MRTLLCILFLAAALCRAEQKNDISYSDAFILGAVEGITEYLPVSSTGHLIIANAALGLDAETPVFDENNLNVLDSKNRPYTLKKLADSYSIIIQMGAIAAVVLLYWRHVCMMALGLAGRNPQGLRLAINIAAAFAPAAALGFFAHKAIERHLFGIVPVIIALAAGAAVMFVAQRLYDKNAKRQNTTLETLTLKQALIIGLCQCVALFPGTSRSMMTILGGYFVGMNAKNSATFSFLLGLVTLGAASAFKIFKDGRAMAEALSPMPMLVGIAVAFVSAALAVKWLVGFLTKHGLVPFAVYRLLLAGALAAMMWLNLR